jgi:hypothetical protein
MGSTYILSGSSSDLSATNVGKRVEVTGTLSSASGSMPGSGSTGSTATGSTSGSTAGSTGGAATGSGSSGATGSSMSGGQHLQVSSVRVVGGDCSSSR